MNIYVYIYANRILDVNVFLKKKPHNEILNALDTWLFKEIICTVNIL